MTGPLVTYGYGELAVKVSLVGSKIANVSVTGLRTAEQYSQSLAQQVIPMLQSQVLQAQNANISGISGATYTSEAFASSLQKALKKVGV
ncbi:MAG TPA: FMN-binding protein [Solirubrobacteraceae bacterium]|nr:FMN-binding protein [Solirubrobacteraceae bacterium]